MIHVVRAGPLTTVQDLGRPGWAHLGVPRSGALDAPALRLANRLVGNPAGAAALESTLLGCAVRLTRSATVAVTGAPCAVRVDDREVAFGAPVAVAAGAVVDVGRASRGLRSYLAISGGVTVEPVLGSRSTDTLSGLGPPKLVNGDTLPIGDPLPFGDPRPMAVEQNRYDMGAATSAGDLTLPIDLGPRADWFTAAAVATLLRAAFVVTPMSNRVGARLAGPALTRANAAELPSEGVVFGAVQVPADGQPLIFLADHPTTGGYPVIGVVADATPLAQARPGTTVRFHGPQR